MALLVIAACLLVCGMSACGASTSNSAASASSAAETVTEASAPATLGERVEIGGLSLKAPADWTANETEDGGMQYYPDDTEPNAIIQVASVEVAIPSGQEETVLQQVLDGALNGLGTEASDMEASFGTVDGHVVQKATFGGELNGVPCSFYWESIALSDKVGMVVAASANGTYDELFSQVIDSIQVTEKQQAPDEVSSEQDAPSAETPSSKADGRIDADKFNAIKQGMSYDEVVGIIGSEGELQSSSTVAGIETSSYSWKSDGWGIATVMFQDGVVVNKTQVGMGGSDGTKATMEAFNQIENGMSYQQVVDIMGGEGELLSETEIAGMSMSIYTWDGNSAFSSCQVTFQDGAVSSKSQYGLK